MDENKLLIDEREMLAKTAKLTQKEKDRELIDRLAEHDINNLVAERQRQAHMKAVLKDELQQQMYPAPYMYHASLTRNDNRSEMSEIDVAVPRGNADKEFVIQLKR
jgi:hypothetical protein